MFRTFQRGLVDLTYTICRQRNLTYRSCAPLGDPYILLVNGEEERRKSISVGKMMMSCRIDVTGLFLSIRKSRQ